MKTVEDLLLTLKKFSACEHSIKWIENNFELGDSPRLVWNRCNHLSWLAWFAIHKDPDNFLSLLDWFIPISAGKSHRELLRLWDKYDKYYYSCDYNPHTGLRMLFELINEMSNAEKLTLISKMHSMYPVLNNQDSTSISQEEFVSND